MGQARQQRRSAALGYSWLRCRHRTPARHRGSSCRCSLNHRLHPRDLLLGCNRMRITFGPMLLERLWVVLTGRMAAGQGRRRSGRPRQGWSAAAARYCPRGRPLSSRAGRCPCRGPPQGVSPAPEDLTDLKMLRGPGTGLPGLAWHSWLAVRGMRKQAWRGPFVQALNKQNSTIVAEQLSYNYGHHFNYLLLRVC